MARILVYTSPARGHLFPMTARAPFDGEDLRGAIAQANPDALVVDVNSWGAMTEAEAWGGPWAAFFPYPMPLDSVDAPPFGPGLRPARTAIGRTRDKLLRPLIVGTMEKTLTPGMNELR